MTDFHFIRPYFLLALIPMLLLTYLLLRRHNISELWGKVIAPHLLDHLLIESGKKSALRPHHLFIFAGFLSIFALAGPTYKKEASPFTEDQAALVIILKTSPSMLAQDIQPNRLSRSAQKIKDLLTLRKGTKTALIAYAGSAHLVLPLTEDQEVLSHFAAELDPAIMPKEGSSLIKALELANKVLKKGKTPGTVLLITDGVNPQEQTELDQVKYPFAVQVYASAGPPGAKAPIDSPMVKPLNESELQLTARKLKGTVTKMTVDDADLKNLNSHIESSMQASMKEGGERWKDSGYAFVPILLILSLLWFRKGWELNYE
jgi:Ca-activated chloride channel homolog